MNFFRRFALWGTEDAGGGKDGGAPSLHLLALEPRIVYDAAGVATVAQDDGAHRDAAAPDPPHDAHPADGFETGVNRTLAAFKAFAAPAADFPPAREPVISAPLEAPRASPTAILFVDSRVVDYRQLTHGLDANVKVVMLAENEDGVNRITRELALLDNLDAVHIVSHGESGSITLGSTELTRETLDARPEHFRLWGTALADQADILLYGCDVAEGARGASFIELLSQLTGADVAASTDRTGAAALGGDWELEARAGTVEAGVFAGKAAQAAWQGTLDEAYLASVDSSGNQSNGTFWYTAKTSDDGKIVVFSSDATNLVPGDTNGFTDVFVHNRETGQTTRVSVDSSGNQASGGDSYLPDISPDGRFVVFQSYATNLDTITPDTNAKLDMYIHDCITGKTERVSLDSSGNEANDNSYNPKVSADGRFVTFASEATNLVAGDANAQIDIFVRDRQAGTTERVSVATAGTESNGWSGDACISWDGRFVAFNSQGSNLVVNDTNGVNDIFVRDRQAGTTTRVSVDSLGNESNAFSYSPSLSADGRLVAFVSSGTNLVAGDLNGFSDVFVHDRINGSTVRVSVDSNGNEANGDSYLGMPPSINAHGDRVIFWSNADNLVANDTNGVNDLFIHDLHDGKTTKASSLIDGILASGPVYIDGSGSHLTLLTNVSLSGSDVNGVHDVYVIDLNDAPAVNPSGSASLNAVMENAAAGMGTAVGDIIWPVFDDVDGKEGLVHLAVPGMAVTGVDNVNGAWEYSLDYGASWTPFAGLSNATATLLSGEVRMTSAPLTDTTDIAAADLLINGDTTAAIVLNRPLQNGLNMEGAWNLMEAVNNLDQKLMADVSTLYCSNVAATLGGSTDVDFYLNGVHVTFNTNTAVLSVLISDTVNAINAKMDLTGVIAYAGNGTNGGVTDAIVLRNVEPGDKSLISITDFSETGTASTGLGNVFQLADPTHNTAEITFFSQGRFVVSTTGGSDAILNRIGLGGGSATTGQPGDTAGDGKILVSSGPARVRFVPAANFSGTAEITFKLWDQSDSDHGSGETNVDVTAGGGASAFSVASTSAAIEVNPAFTPVLVLDGPEIQVNTTTVNAQLNPVAATLAGGDVVLVWQSDGQDGAGYGVYGRMFAGDGTPLGGEFSVNQYTADDQHQQSVAALNDGGFVVIWSSFQETGDYNVYGRKFDAAGAPAGGEFRINTTTASDQFTLGTGRPVTALADGGFLVSWSSWNQDGAGWGVYGQRFDAAANPVGGEFLVNLTTALDQTGQAVTGFANGGFMVAWNSSGQDGDQGGIFQAGFHGYGELIVGEAPVNTTTAGDQKEPAITALNNGGYVVVWVSDGQDTAQGGIFARRYDSFGSPVTPEVQVNTTVTDNQSRPAIATLDDGGFVIVWQSNLQDGSGYGIFGQRYDANGVEVGGEFYVNRVTSLDQTTPLVTGLHGGGFLVAWTSDLQDGGSLGVYAQRFAFNQAPVLDNTGSMSLGSVLENSTGAPGDTVGDIIASTGADRITDLNNNGFEGIAVITVDNVNGLWEYSTDNGAIWHDFAGVSGISAVLLADDPSTRIRFTPSPGFNGTADITFRAWDQSFGGNGDTGVNVSVNGGDAAFSAATEVASISVDPVNDAPVLDNAASPALPAINEDGVSAATVGALLVNGSITDPDGAAVEAMAIVAADNTNGAWQYSLDSGATWLPVNDGGLGAAHALLLNGSDPAQMLRFVPAADWSGTATLSFHAWDTSSGVAGDYADASVTGGTSAFSVDSDTVGVVVNAVNDAPALSAGAVLAYTVDDPAMLVHGGIMVTDVDNATLQSAEVTVSAGYSQGTDLLSCTPAGGLAVVWDAGTASLSITGSASVADYQATLGSVRFASLGGASPAGARTVSFEVHDGAAASAVASATVNVSVAPPPPPPPPPVEPPPVEPPPVEPPPVEPPPVEPPPVEPPPVEPPPVAPPPAEVQPPPPPYITKTEPGLAEPLTPAASLPLFQPAGVSGAGPVAGAEAEAGSAGIFGPEVESLTGADALAFFSDTARAADPFAPSEAPATGEGTEAADAAAMTPVEAAAEEVKEATDEEQVTEEEAAPEEEAGAEEETAETEAAAGEATETPAAKGQAKDQKTAGKPGEIQQPVAEADKAQAERAEILKVFDEVYKLTQCN